MEQDKNKKASPFGGMRQARRAVSDFLRAGRRNETGKQDSGESAFVLMNRIRGRADDEFGEALRSGALTTDQVRKAGEHDWNTWMGDVWSETDWPDKVPEPTYDEFMADPEKYGYQRGINEETDRAFDRYRSAGAHPAVTKKR